MRPGFLAHPSRRLLTQAPQDKVSKWIESMAIASIIVSESPLVLYTLRRADDALILGHRLSEWCGHAPMLEEDMALANIALDLLGQARELYSHAAKVEGRDNNEDKLAYLRDVRQYRNLLLAEQPNGDFARTIVRQFFYSAFADLYWRAMMTSSDPTLAAIAAKSEKESAYHLRHSSEWIVRLGDGTDESHRRTQTAIDDLWAFTGEMFVVDDSERALIDAGIAVDPESLRSRWLQTVSDVVGEATLAVPKNDWMQQGGRSGRHSEHLGHLLSELQSMQRTFPGVTW
jgi:ring-1,2-phenylacetyl-CoA epoxidase subunit PaaC